MVSLSEYNMTALRISRAFVSLVTRSEDDAKVVSLAWIGDHEIRMQAAPPTAGERPLFILDIFDHDAQSLIDRRACHSLAEGATAFEEFLSTMEPADAGKPR